MMTSHNTMNHLALLKVGIDAEYRNFENHGFGEQLTWLAADLGTVNRTVTPWARCSFSD
jgi:hypothetical protein